MIINGLIYVEQISERIRFVEKVFFSERGMNVQFTNDKQLFAAFEGEKLNYSNEFFTGVPTLIPAKLLFSEKVIPIDVNRSDWNDFPCMRFDGVQDPLATVFYCLSRYEEYLPFTADVHGRYLATNSILYNEFDLKEQVVERCFSGFLKIYFQKLEIAYSKQFVSRFVPSFDIDNTFAYSWKEGWRTWLSVAKDRLKGNKTRLEQRKRVQQGMEKDPYDSFAEIEAVAEKHPASRIFWLLGDFRKYDKNITWSDPRHQRLIRKLDALAGLGLHPSYASNTEPARLQLEADRLKKILGRPIAISRQHFLKLRFPDTYRSLLNAGFTEDYTMGYADQMGFRAGTAHPFLWFDLQQNVTTSLVVHPFAYMDGTLNEYRKLSIPEAISEVKQLIDEVRQYGGDFCFIWHNETFAESGIWKGWKQVYDETERYWNEGN